TALAYFPIVSLSDYDVPVAVPPARPEMHGALLMKRRLAVLLMLIAPAAATAAGHRLLVADYSKHRIAIIGADGKTEWEHKIGDLHDLHLLENGNVLCQLSWTRLVEIDPRTDQVVWEYDAATSNGNAGQ